MKKYEKNLRLRVALAVISVLMVAVVLCGYIADMTLSKYRSKINGYTNFTPAEFHAMLLGNEDEESITEKWLTGSSAELFGEEITIDVLQPGGESEIIPFLLANATAADKISVVDIVYSLTLRTVANLPLEFTILRKVDSSAVSDATTVNSDGFETYKTGSLYATDAGDTGDAPVRIYSFYQVHSAGLEGECMETEAAVFTLTGGKLSTDEFRLVIDWPVKVGENGKSTDDPDYMKETDVIELVADLVSDERRDSYTGTVFPVPTILEEHGHGLFVFYPSAECYKVESSANMTGDTEYTYRYKFTHNAFGSVDEALYTVSIGETHVTDPAEVGEQVPNIIASSMTSSAYKIMVTNGNSILDATGTPISDMSTKTVDFKMKVYFPLTKDTISSDGVLKTKFDVLAQFPDGTVRISTPATYDAKTIAKYDLETGVFTEIGSNLGADMFAQIGELVNSSAYDCYSERYRYYYVYNFAMVDETGTEAVIYDYYYNYQLQNYNDDGTRKLDYISFVLLTNMSPEDMYALPVYNEFYIEAIAVYKTED